MSKLHLAKGSQIPKLPEDGILRLYSMRFCPYAHRAHLVLDAKKIPYHTININLKAKPEWLTQKSSLGKVPALEIPSKGDSLIESLIIAEYLDEQYPEYPLRASDPLQRARDKILVELFTTGLNAILPKLIYVKGTPENIPTSVEELDKFFDIYEAELKTRGTKFFGGSQPGFVDYMIWPWFERSETASIIAGTQDKKPNTARFGSLIGYTNAMKQDPAVKISSVSPENHLKFIQSMMNTDAPLYDMLA